MKTDTSKVEATNQPATSTSTENENLHTDNVETTDGQGADILETNDNPAADIPETVKETASTRVVYDWLKPKMTTSINAEYLGKMRTVLVAMNDDSVNNVTLLLKKLVENYLTYSSQNSDLERQIKDLTELNNSNEDSYHNAIDKITLLEKELKDAQFEINLLKNPESEKFKMPLGDAVPVKSAAPVKKETSFMEYLGF